MRLLHVESTRHLLDMLQEQQGRIVSCETKIKELAQALYSDSSHSTASMSEWIACQEEMADEDEPELQMGQEANFEDGAGHCC